MFHGQCTLMVPALRCSAMARVVPYPIPGALRHSDHWVRRRFPGRLCRNVVTLVIAAFIQLPVYGAEALLLGRPVAIARSAQAYADSRHRMHHPVRLNRGLFQRLMLNQRLPLGLPVAPEMEMVVDRLVSHGNGDRTVVGSVLVAGGGDFRIVITGGPAGAVGVIHIPGRSLRLRLDEEGEWLLDPLDSGMMPAPAWDNDSRMPPRSEAVPRLQAAAPEASTQLRPPAVVVIDLLLLYTPGLTASYGGAQGVQTRLNNLVEVSNQAYLDSGVAISLRLVHSAEINYNDATPNTRALDAVTSGSTPFQAVQSLRLQYGADLVSVVRPYQYPVHGNCGITWQLGMNGDFLADDPEFAYSVVSDGEDAVARTLCNDYVLVHELGHNMGSAHDRDHTFNTGIYSYSYGYGQSGAFGTIMSYIQPVVGRFSSPTLVCEDQPCGLPRGQPGAADNVSSLNAVRGRVAAFQPAVLPPPPIPHTRIGIYFPAGSQYHLRNSLTGGAANIAFQFAVPDPEAIPLAGDWNGNGISSPGLYYPQNSSFVLRNSNSAGPAEVAFRYGPMRAGWMPVSGDWDGDGVYSVGLYDPLAGRFHLRNRNASGVADLVVALGPRNSIGWLPLAGDWNGDGVSGVGLYQPALGLFKLLDLPGTGSTNLQFRYGPRAVGLRPLAGDWDGDGSFSVGLYNPARGLYWLRNTNTPGYANVTIRYGPLNGDALPLAGDWDGAPTR